MGLEGRVGDAPVTPDFMLKLGWATGKVFAATDGSRPTVVIGKDTRVSGYMLESALQAGLVAAGANVKLAGSTPDTGYRAVDPQPEGRCRHCYQRIAQPLLRQWD
jgi:phosphoglucosamine mutase